MRNIQSFLFFVGALVVFSAAADLDRDLLERDQFVNPSPSVKPPEVKAKQLVKESSSFLRQREPEMSDEEYALYEKVVTMLTANPAFAVRMLEAMMNEKERPSPAFEFILGNAYYAAEQLERAEQSYRSAVTRYPDFLRAWKNLGVLHYSTGRFAEAAKCFAKTVQLGDRDPATFGLLGFSLERQGDAVSAEMAYMQALGVDPANADWKEGLLRIYIEGKQYGRAEPLARSLIRDRPTETRLWLNYAGLLISDKRKLEAMAVLESARAAGAAGPDELVLLGDLYSEQGLTAEAVLAYSKVLPPDRARGEQRLLYFAQVLIAEGQLSEAERALSAITGEITSPSRLALLQGRADLQMARKRWPEARKEIETLLTWDPLNGRALLTLGRTHVEENDLPRATFAFEAAYRISESAYRASLELANLELKNRHYAKAVEYLEHALRLQKSDAVENYLARVKTLVPVDPNAG